MRVVGPWPGADFDECASVEGSAIDRDTFIIEGRKLAEIGNR